MEKKLIAARDRETEVTVEVHGWVDSQEIRGQYIEYKKSIFIIWNYWRRFGVRAVFRKVRSRFAERTRNLRVYGVGFGMLVDAPVGFESFLGRHVLFFAPNHSLTASLVVVDVGGVLFIDLSGKSTQVSSDSEITSLEELEEFSGWCRYSGSPYPEEKVQSVLRKFEPLVKSEIKDCDRDSKTNLDFEPATATKEEGTRKASKALNAVLFGLGNYAKTIIIPNIRKHIVLERVHEIDIDQIAFASTFKGVSLDTSDCYRPNSGPYAVWFIAGYHHTHAQLAVDALKQGAVAVIEKPLATTKTDHVCFLEALKKVDKGRFYMCFQKRYSDLHKYVLRDLEIAGEEVVDMHCIVFEIPLPQLHWYNWPNSGSRLISNGCHWIDYFLCLNNYSGVVDKNVWKGRGADVFVHLKLENGACFSMVLTDKGSARLGVREHIELRAGGLTVKIDDASIYESENGRRVVRRVRVNPLKAYSNMYRTISQEISAGGDGDSQRSLYSSLVTLELEEVLGEN